MSARSAIRVVSMLAGGLALAAPAQAAPKAPKLTALRCVPASSEKCERGVKVSVGEHVALRGRRLARGQRVTFRSSKVTKTAKITRVKGASRAVKVPRGLKVGTVSVRVTDGKGRRSNRLKLKIVAPDVPTSRPDPAPAPNGPAAGSNAVPAPFKGRSAWIWTIDQAEGGNASAIIEKAKAAGLSTVFLKSYDGTDSVGSQFSRTLVDLFHANGLYLCAWQFIYGANPLGEAAAAIESVKAGADCLTVNVENQYAGRRAEAQQFLSAFRAAPQVGNDYPLGFSSFADILKQPDVPYSVFLGPRGGAQVGMPQVYWEEQGSTVGALSQLAASDWRIFGRPIVPMGQIFDQGTVDIRADDILEFRSVWQQYGAPGVSYFRWGAGEPADVWSAFGAAVPTFDPPAEAVPHKFAQGMRADAVRWIQQHLAAFDPSIVIDGQFGPGTESILRAFQVAKGLDSTGATGPQTWTALLNERYTYVDWATGARSGVK